METGTGGGRVRRGLAVLLALALALTAGGGAALALLGAEDTRILPGVSAAGVDLGGLTAEEAEALLRREGTDCGGTRVLLCAGDTLLASVTCAEIGAAPDWAGTAALARQAGREEGTSLLGRGWRRLFPTETVIALPFTVDRSRLEALLPPQPRDAAYDPDTGEIREGRPGVRLDLPELCRALSQAPPGGEVRLQVEVIPPELDGEHLRTALFRDVLGEYQTQVGGSAVRRRNVALSAAAVDGTVLLPGETFDYNAVVGQRTEERGYGAAPAYVNGETVEEIGGGICQTSSTLYAAALLADLEITARSAHRYVSSYIPPGLDAAVSWGGPEFRFRNDTRYPLRLQASIEDRTLTVTILGTRTGASQVRMRSEVLSTDPCRTRCQEAPDLPAGEERVKQSGLNGCTVQTYREVYDAEGNLLYTSAEARSVYRRRDKIVLRGVGEEDAAQAEEGARVPRAGGTAGAVPEPFVRRPGA